MGHKLPHHTVSLTGSLTIRTANSVRAQLLDAVAKGHAVTVDCSGADEVDLTFVQLLVAARASAGRAGGGLALTQPAGGALMAALRQGGFINGDRDDDRFWTTGGK